MKTAIELWQYVSRKGLKPLPKTSVSEWADNYRIISQGNAEPGRWRTSRAEYQREIMDSFTQGGIHRVVVKSAAQIGKSDLTFRKNVAYFSFAYYTNHLHNNRRIGNGT